MPKAILLAACATVLGLSAALTAAGTVGAAPLPQATEIELWNADLDAFLAGADLNHRRPGKGNELRACQEAVRTIHKACPCEGVDMDGDGTVDPWGSHEAFMECVLATADQVKTNTDDPLSEDCVVLVDKVVERLNDSEIGNDGYECPNRKCAGGQRQPRDPRKPGGGR